MILEFTKSRQAQKKTGELALICQELFFCCKTIFLLKLQLTQISVQAHF